MGVEKYPEALEFILHWGEMGTHWGANRSVAQVHALLYLSDQPLDAEAICEALDLARSNVSNALKELQGFGIVRRTHIPGDRRDQDIVEQTQILGQSFDDVVLYQDACQRGRADGEVLALLRQGLQGVPRTTRVDEVRGEFAAIDHALARLRPGDLCLVLVDQVDEALAHLTLRQTQAGCIA